MLMAIRVTIAVILVLLCGLSTIGAVSGLERSFTVGPFEGHIMWWTLEGNENVTGTVFISHNIEFCITDPDGYIIENFGTIDKSAPFQFEASKPGNFTLHFRSSYFGGINVKVAYDIQQPINDPPDAVLDSANAAFLFPIILLSCVVVVVCLLLFFLKVIRKRGHK